MWFLLPHPDIHQIIMNAVVKIIYQVSNRMATKCKVWGLKCMTGVASSMVSRGRAGSTAHEAGELLQKEWGLGPAAEREAKTKDEHEEGTGW